MNNAALHETRDTGRDGFTLVELLVVLAIVAILSAVAAPSVSAWIQNYQAKTTARKLLTDLQFTRMSAVSLKQNCTVTVNPGTASTYTMLINGNLTTRQMNPEVVLGANSAPNALVITFYPLGTATFSAAIANGTEAEATVSQGGTAPWNVIVNIMGGVQISGGPQFAL
jgi:prepilin-type N-terminal cleavage/methylation domain-containing protein